MSFGISAATWVGLGSAALGAVGTGGSSKKESKAEPWAPAQPYILDNLEDTSKLKNYYQQNPFNQQQQTSYQNLFGDLDNFRTNIAPGLMDFANRGMTNSYQRPPVGNPGDGAGYIRPQQMQQQSGQATGASPFGNQQQMQQQTQQMQQLRNQYLQQPQGLLSQGPFSVPQRPQQGYGLIDFQAQNPFSNGSIPAEAAPVQAPVQRPRVDERGWEWDENTQSYHPGYA